MTARIWLSAVAMTRMKSRDPFHVVQVDLPSRATFRSPDDGQEKGSVSMLPVLFALVKTVIHKQMPHTSCTLQEGPLELKTNHNVARRQLRKKRL